MKYVIILALGFFIGAGVMFGIAVHGDAQGESLLSTQLKEQKSLTHTFRTENTRLSLELAKCKIEHKNNE